MTHYCQRGQDGVLRPLLGSWGLAELEDWGAQLERREYHANILARRLAKEDASYRRSLAKWTDWVLSPPTLDTPEEWAPWLELAKHRGGHA